MSVPLRKDEIEFVPYAPLLTEIHEVEVSRAPRQKTRNRLLIATVGVSLLAGIGIGIMAPSLFPNAQKSDSLSLLAVQTDTNAPALESASASRRLGFVTVSGSLRSTKALANTEAIVELLDRNSHTLRVERALVARNIAGASAPFQVLLPDDDRASAYRIYFQPLNSTATKSL